MPARFSQLKIAPEWEKPRITAGLLNRNPMLGEHLMGSFGRLLGGNAGATCYSQVCTLGRLALKSNGTILAIVFRDRCHGGRDGIETTTGVGRHL